MPSFDVADGIVLIRATVVDLRKAAVNGKIGVVVKWMTLYFSVLVAFPSSAADFNGVDADLYLSVDGSDENDGLAPESPVASITNAYAIAEGMVATGDVVVAVAEGEYPSGTWVPSVEHENEIVFRSVGGSEKTAIKGNPADHPLSATYWNTFLGNRGPRGDGRSIVAFEGFTITGFNGTNRTSSAEWDTGILRGVVCRNCVITGNDTRVHHGWIASSTLENCIVTGNRVAGIPSFQGGEWFEDIAETVFGDPRDLLSCRLYGCRVYGNDFGLVHRLSNYLTSSNCLFVVETGESKYWTSSHDTLVAERYTCATNDFFGATTSVSPLTNGRKDGLLAVIADRGRATAAQVPERVYVSLDETVSYAITSNANLTADFTAADVSSVAVRDDGLPDFGCFDSGFGPRKTAAAARARYAGRAPQSVDVNAIATVTVTNDTTVSAMNASMPDGASAVVFIFDRGAEVFVDEPLASAVPVAADCRGRLSLVAEGLPESHGLDRVDFAAVNGSVVRSWLPDPGVIGFNFGASAGTDVESALEEGVWHHTDAAEGELGGLFADGMSVLSWRSSGIACAPGGGFMDGALGDADGEASISLSAVPYDAYDLVVYCSSTNADARFTVKTANGRRYSWSGAMRTAVVTNNASALWGSAASDGVGYGVNAIRINALSGALTLVSTASGATANACGAVAAIQLLGAGTTTAPSVMWTKGSMNPSFDDPGNWSGDELPCDWQDVVVRVASGLYTEIAVEGVYRQGRLTVDGGGTAVFSGGGAVSAQSARIAEGTALVSPGLVDFQSLTVERGARLVMTPDGASGMPSYTLADLVLHGEISQTAKGGVVAVTRSLAGSGRTCSLALGSDAVVLLDGSGCVTLAGDFAWSGSVRFDLSGVEWSGRRNVPIIRVTASNASALPSEASLLFSSPPPGGWRLERTLDGLGWRFRKDGFALSVR